MTIAFDFWTKLLLFIFGLLGLVPLAGCGSTESQAAWDKLTPQEKVAVVSSSVNAAAAAGVAADATIILQDDAEVYLKQAAGAKGPIHATIHLSANPPLGVHAAANLPAMKPE